MENIIGKIILYGLILGTLGTFTTMYVQNKKNFENSEQGKIESIYKQKKIHYKMFMN